MIVYRICRIIFAVMLLCGMVHYHDFEHTLLYLSVFFIISSQTDIERKLKVFDDYKLSDNIGVEKTDRIG